MLLCLQDSVYLPSDNECVYLPSDNECVYLPSDKQCVYLTSGRLLSNSSLAFKSRTSKIIH